MQDVSDEYMAVLIYSLEVIMNDPVCACIGPCILLCLDNRCQHQCGTHWYGCQDQDQDQDEGMPAMSPEAKADRAAIIGF